LNWPEAVLFRKHWFAARGIGPAEYRRMQLRDIEDIMAIENMLKEKEGAEHAIYDAILKIGGR